MNVVQIGNVCTSYLSFRCAELINKVGWLGRTSRGLDFVGRMAVHLLQRQSGGMDQVIRNDLQAILGEEKNQSRTICSAYFKRRSSFHVLDELLSENYLEKFDIQIQPEIDISEFDTGVVFALLHTVDPYLLTAVVGKIASKNFTSDFNLLRAPLSQEEDRRFAVISSWAGVNHLVNYVNPGLTSEVKNVVRSCRKGMNLVSFVDMPASFGRSPPVNFFGRKAWMSLGVTDIAKLAGVSTYVSYFIRSEHSPHKLTLCFEKVDSLSGSAQAVVNCLQRVIKRAPQDWDFLATLRSYYYHPGLK